MGNQKTSRSNTKPDLKLHFYAKTVVLATLVLLSAGGLVTSTDSGLSVPDWPLSYGQVFPPMVGGVRFEHSHRLIAAFVGLLTLILTIAIFRSESRKSARRLGLAAIVAVIAQALLGGLTVILLLPPAVSILHACLGQTFFCIVVSIALITSKEWRGGVSLESENARPLRILPLITTIFIFIQLFVGALVRHTGGTGLNYHFIFAFLILLHAIFILLRISRESAVSQRFMGHALLFLFLVLTQIGLGFGAWLFTLVLEKGVMPRFQEVLFATAHQANGAMVLATCLTLTLRIFRLVKNK